MRKDGAPPLEPERFSSTVHGNLLGEDEEFRKLAMTVEIAHDVWGF